MQILISLFFIILLIGIFFGVHYLFEKFIDKKSFFKEIDLMNIFLILGIFLITKYNYEMSYFPYYLITFFLYGMFSAYFLYFYYEELMYSTYYKIFWRGLFFINIIIYVFFLLINFI